MEDRPLCQSQSAKPAHSQPAPCCGTVDGVAAVAHTEGETLHAHNRPLLLRTLAGLLVHPNVGAALVVATGTERRVRRKERGRL